jgi:hypothetical protein
VQAIDGREEPQIIDRWLTTLLSEGNPHHEVRSIRKKLVERRVKQTDGDRKAIHRVQNATEILSLKRQEIIQCGLPRLCALGENDALDEDPAVAEEHMLRATQTNASAPEPTCSGSILRSIRISANGEAGAPIGVAQQAINRRHQRSGLTIGTVKRSGQPLLEVARHRRSNNGQRTGKDLPR